MWDNRYNNKYFSVLGDSISTLGKYTKPEDAAFYEGMIKLEADIFVPSDTWWGMLIEHLGGNLLVNNSFSGCCVTKRPGVMIPSFGCSDERTFSLHKDSAFPDVIMVFMGINDFGHGAVTSPAIPDQKTDISVFSVAYGKMLEKLKTNYPKAEIWCFTFPITFRKSNEDFKFPHVLRGHHAEDYCRVIIESAKIFDCMVIDLYRSGTLVDTIDGFHPNKDGMISIFESAVKILNEGGYQCLP